MRRYVHTHAFAAFIVAAVSAPSACRAFLVPSSLSSPRQVSLKTSSSSPITTESNNVMGGVDEFETWFTAEPGTSCAPSIQHANFNGSLRGLAYTSDEPLPTTPVMKVPESIVLSAPYSDPDWDVQLSRQLWKECLKGEKSSIHGYCSLLTLGNAVSPSSSNIPPSTAPNALRHWTTDQKALLERSTKGTKLVQAQQAQSLSWKNKYTAVENEMTCPQFEWCMEVVHSRAFCGIGGSENAFTFVAASAPVLAGAAGFAYIQDNPFPDDRLLVGLAVLGALPVLASLVSEEKGRAVLFPLIDSANHLSTADSCIEYNPLTKAFELGIGPNCLVKDGQQTQLYVSYGEKSDAELLLNYGFLPNVSVDDDGNDEAAIDKQRTRLAKAFIERNP